jgi:hypothetical protein
MEKDLFNYLTTDEKIKMANRLLRSALVYEHVKFLMTGEKEKTSSGKREQFDQTRDIAHVIHCEMPHPDRLRNYRAICQNEIDDMEELLKDKSIRMRVVKEIMTEERMDLKKDYSFCLMSVKGRLCEFKPVQKMNSLVLNMLSKMRGRTA